MNRPARLARAAASAAAILAILIGLPLALWLLGQQFLPDSMPSWTRLVDALSRPDDGRLLLGLLVVVGVVAWLILAVSILAELVAVVARRPALRINLPGFRLSHGIAAALVAALLGLGATPAIAAPVTGAAAWAAPVVPGAAEDADPPPAGPIYLVAARDTLWSIAAHALGDPLRWHEIYDLNKNRPQPDGSLLTEASVLHAGWRLVLPADARPVEEATVVPGDTLTGIAADDLGSPARANEIYEANRGRLQSDGRALTDPDLLRPGWVLT